MTVSYCTVPLDKTFACDDSRRRRKLEFEKRKGNEVRKEGRRRNEDVDDNYGNLTNTTMASIRAGWDSPIFKWRALT
jgi:hypothetical protein